MLGILSITSKWNCWALKFTISLKCLIILFPEIFLLWLCRVISIRDLVRARCQNKPGVRSGLGCVGFFDLSNTDNETELTAGERHT